MCSSGASPPPGRFARSAAPAQGREARRVRALVVVRAVVGDLGAQGRAGLGLAHLEAGQAP
jgi:hypothetical protein